MNGRGSFPVANTERELGSIPALLYGLVLPCKVSQTNYEAGKVRLTIHEGGMDAFVTEWVPWIAPRSGNTREWNPPEIGEKGLLISPSGKTKNGYYMPASFYSEAPLPSSLVDEHKIIYLKEEIGLYTYDRRTGRRRWRIHGAGEYRHEIGIFEETGDKDTSDIIQRRDMIQLRVGTTRLVIKDGLIRSYVADGEGNVSETKLDVDGFDAIAKGRGVLKLREKEASIGVTKSKIDTSSIPYPIPLSGLVASDEGAQIGFNDQTVVKVDAEASIESALGQSRIVLNQVGTRIMAGESVFVLTSVVADVRVPGSSITLIQDEIALVSRALVISESAAPPAIFQGGSQFKFNVPNKLATPTTPNPAEISKQFKPYMPKD